MRFLELHERAEVHPDIAQEGINQIKEALRSYGIGLDQCAFSVVSLDTTRNGPSNGAAFIKIGTTPEDDILAIACLIRGREPHTPAACYGIEIADTSFFIPANMHWRDLATLLKE